MVKNLTLDEIYELEAAHPPLVGNRTSVFLVPKKSRGASIPEARAIAHRKDRALGAQRNPTQSRKNSSFYELIRKSMDRKFVEAGGVIVQQSGSRGGARFTAGRNVGTGRDWTLFALVTGNVKMDRDGKHIHVVDIGRGRTEVSKKQV